MLIKPTDVDSYIGFADQKAQPILNELRQVILETIPEVEEKISYGVPFYKYFGEFVGFAVYKKHVSFGFGADVLSPEERKSLWDKGYTLGKATMQIKFDQEVPTTEIIEILKTKARINEVGSLG